MRKLLLVLSLVLFSSFGLAQSSDSLKDSLSNAAIDIYIPVPSVSIEPLPPVLVLTHVANAAPVLQRSSSGAAKTYYEHKLSCAAHREFSFLTRKWNIVPSLPEWQCNELWGKYLQTKKKIGYQPNNSILWNTKN